MMFNQTFAFIKRLSLETIDQARSYQAMHNLGEKLLEDCGIKANSKSEFQQPPIVRVRREITRGL